MNNGLHMKIAGAISGLLKNKLFLNLSTQTSEVQTVDDYVNCSTRKVKTINWDNALNLIFLWLNTFEQSMPCEEK